MVCKDAYLNTLLLLHIYAQRGEDVAKMGMLEANH